MNTDTPRPASPIAPIPFAVTHLDGSVEQLVIKQLSITNLYKWLFLAKDQSEPAMVCLALGKDEAWVNDLTVDSFAKLAGECNKVLFPQAARLAKHAPQAAALYAPLVRINDLGLRVNAILSTGSGEPSSKPQAAASVAGTSSASPTATLSTPSVPSLNPEPATSQPAT